MKKFIKIFTTIGILLAIIIGSIRSYPTGAPKCSATAPKHEDHKAQTTPSPYQITASKTGKSTASVTISGGDFKGFMLYAAKPGSNDMIGTFTKTDKSKEITCGSASAITHKNDKAKSSITLTWNAPDKFTGDVEFRASVVKEFKEFWSGLKSPKVTFK
ncbi:putative defense protein 3 [Dermatophagoides farinae]|uniref:putative defense protein 3 n=1 Tax=Dermatophagoides farinae TaxID=6954 RepID=UPI001F0CFC0B|nr:putative defense protein 3 [Dermatophagoides farinae]